MADACLDGLHPSTIERRAPGVCNEARLTTLRRDLRLLAFAALAATVPIGRASATPFAYISSGTDVDQIDIATNTVVATIPVGTTCGGAAVSPDGSHVYLTCNSSSLWVIDT